MGEACIRTAVRSLRGAWMCSTGWTPTVTVGDASTLGAQFSQNKVNNIQALANQQYKEVLTKQNSEYSAAFQLAFWEILFEAPGAGYDIDSGTFKGTNLSNRNGGRKPRVHWPSPGLSRSPPPR